MNEIYKKWLQEGCYVSSSGTTGTPKKVFQPPKKLAAMCDVAIKRQNIVPTSRVLTVCKMGHAGGALAQTLPAISIGAYVNIQPFNAFTFLSELLENNYTHTHLTPAHCKAIMLTKGWENANLSGIWVTCGSDPVTWDMIESFVNRGATFMANWGMSEIGPVAINSIFDNIEKVKHVKSFCPDNCTIMGDTYCCDYKVIDNVLHVKGDISVYDDWYNTKDKVKVVNDIMFYNGRALD